MAKNNDIITLHQIKLLRDQGLSCAAIGEKVGLSKASIVAKLKILAHTKKIEIECNSPELIETVNTVRLQVGNSLTSAFRDGAELLQSIASSVKKAHASGECDDLMASAIIEKVINSAIKVKDAMEFTPAIVLEEAHQMQQDNHIRFELVGIAATPMEDIKDGN